MFLENPFEGFIIESFYFRNKILLTSTAFTLCSLEGGRGQDFFFFFSPQETTSKEEAVVLGSWVVSL